MVTKNEKAFISLRRGRRSRVRRSPRSSPSRRSPVLSKLSPFMSVTFMEWDTPVSRLGSLLLGDSTLLMAYRPWLVYDSVQQNQDSIPPVSSYYLWHSQVTTSFSPSFSTYVHTGISPLVHESFLQKVNSFSLKVLVPSVRLSWVQQDSVLCIQSPQLVHLVWSTFRTCDEDTDLGKITGCQV